MTVCFAIVGDWRAAIIKPIYARVAIAKQIYARHVEFDQVQGGIFIMPYLL